MATRSGLKRLTALAATAAIGLAVAVPAQPAHATYLGSTSGRIAFVCREPFEGSHA